MGALDQLENETNLAYTAFLDYVELGAKRTHERLLELYRERANGGNTEGDAVTKRRATIERWSSQYKWQARIKEYLAERRDGLDNYGREWMLGYEQRILDNFDRLAAKVDDQIERMDTLTQTKRTEIDDPQRAGQRMRVVTMRANTLELYRLVRAWDSLARGVREQLGLDETLTIKRTGGGTTRITEIYVNMDDDDDPDA